MTRRSTIMVSDRARQVRPSLPTGHVLEQLKNFILEKIRETEPELVARMDELDLLNPSAAIEFAPDHYGPLGLQVVVFRYHGLHVHIGVVGEFADASKEDRS